MIIVDRTEHQNSLSAVSELNTSVEISVILLINEMSLCYSRCWRRPSVPPPRRSRLSSSIPRRRWATAASRPRKRRLPSWVLSRRTVSAQRRPLSLRSPAQPNPDRALRLSRDHPKRLLRTGDTPWFVRTTEDKAVLVQLARMA